MIQIIKCPCGNTFAACMEPYCYQEVDWMRDLRNYQKKGCTVAMIEKQDFEFETCSCKNMNPHKHESKNQLSIF